MRLRVGIIACAFTLSMGGEARALQILSPAPGATVTPGSLVRVVLMPSPGEAITEIAVTAGFAAHKAVPAATPAGAFEAQVRIPIDDVGPRFIVALATLAEGTSAAMEYVPVTVDPGPLRQLFVSAPPTMNAVGQIFDLDVTGLFEDGVLRRLTQPDRGTTYASTDDTVLGVHPSGMIQARSQGSAVVTVSNRGRQATASVQVAVPRTATNRIPVPDPGPDQIVPPEVSVALSASNSSDPDGDPLQYRWSQQSGPAIALRGDNTVEASFGSPHVLTEQTLVFSLVVIDSKGAVSFPALVRVTVRP
jgi:hypothetical protein